MLKALCILTQPTSLHFYSVSCHILTFSRFKKSNFENAFLMHFSFILFSMDYCTKKGTRWILACTLYKKHSCLLPSTFLPAAFQKSRRKKTIYFIHSCQVSPKNVSSKIAQLTMPLSFFLAISMFCTKWKWTDSTCGWIAVSNQVSPPPSFNSSQNQHNTKEKTVPFIHCHHTTPPPPLPTHLKKNIDLVLSEEKNFSFLDDDDDDCMHAVQPKKGGLVWRWRVNYVKMRNDLK